MHVYRKRIADIKTAPDEGGCLHCLHSMPCGIEHVACLQRDWGFQGAHVNGAVARAGEEVHAVL